MSLVPLKNSKNSKVEMNSSSLLNIVKTFNSFFECLVEVMDDFEMEEKNNSKNDKVENNDSFFNPFYHQVFGSKEKILTQIKEKVLKFVLKLNFQESTLVLSFIYIDRLLKVDKRITRNKFNSFFTSH